MRRTKVELIKNLHEREIQICNPKKIIKWHLRADDSLISEEKFQSFGRKEFRRLMEVWLEVVIMKSKNNKENIKNISSLKFIRAGRILFLVEFPGLSGWSQSNPNVANHQQKTNCDQNDSLGSSALLFSETIFRFFQFSLELLEVLGEAFALELQ